MPPKKGNAEEKETPVKTSGVLTRRQASVVERTRTRTAASLGPEEKKQPHVWSDPPDTRRGRKRARVDNAEAPEVAVEEANPVEEEVPNSGEGVAAEAEEVKSDQDEVEGLAAKYSEAAKSVEEESLAVTYGEGQASSSKDKGKRKKANKSSRPMLISHCMHSGDLFMTKAAEVKAALQGCGRIVRTDTKIRRGSFEVREVGGAAIVQLMDMEEPYQELVNLDAETIVTAAIAL